MGWWLPVCSPSKWTLFHLFYLFHHQAPHWTGWTLLVTRRSYLSRGRHLWRPPIVFPATRNDKPRFTATSWLYVEQCHKTPIYPYEWMDYMVSTTHLYHFISIEMVIRWRRLIALDQNHGTSLSPRQDASCSTGRPVSLLACASEMTWSRRVLGSAFPLLRCWALDSRTYPLVI